LKNKINNKMDRVIEQKVAAYAQKNYPRRYEGRYLMVEERENHFRVKANKDESPMILGKSILN
jgi:hypothetical protein